MKTEQADALQIVYCKYCMYVNEFTVQIKRISNMKVQTLH